MIKTAKDYGADFILVGGLTLFGNGPTDCKTLYHQVLEKYFQDLVPKYKSLFRIFFAPPKEYQKALEENPKAYALNMVLNTGSYDENFVRNFSKPLSEIRLSEVRQTG